MILKYGKKSAAVAELQTLLAGKGHPVEVSGQFDEATEQAVKAFQAANGLMVDGIWGSQSAAAAAGTPLPRTLSQADIQAAAEQLGVEAAAVHAVHRVESRGRGFLPDGRVLILFERHIFYRELAKKHGRAAAERWAREAPHICSKTPGGYRGGVAEYPRFSRAFGIDAEAAMKSCSWGMYQIMGFNHKSCGFATVDELVDAMKSGEAAQLAAFARFIAADKGLHTALKNKDWPDFARRYNGPAYQKNDYDSKLAAAYRRFAA